MRSLLAALSLSLLTACASNPMRTPHPESGVMVMVGDGHGSGVYIGGGIVLTSAHVVQDEAEVTLKSASGGWQRAAIIWKSTKYDIAALRPANPKLYTKAPLSCAEPVVGEYAVAYGSPIKDEFLYQPGFVAGKPVRLGELESVARAAMPVTSGNSGGPVFGADGSVIGIVAAVQVASIFNSTSQTGIAYFVPGNVICALLGRA